MLPTEIQNWMKYDYDLQSIACQVWLPFSELFPLCMGILLSCSFLWIQVYTNREIWGGGIGLRNRNITADFSLMTIIWWDSMTLLLGLVE